MQQHKVLLLSVSAGSGHIRAAEAIKAYAAPNSSIEIVHFDVMDYVPKLFRKIYTDAYIKLVQKFPMLWGLLYKKTDSAQTTGVLQRFRRYIEQLNTKALIKAIDDFKPDVVICTHFLPAEILMHQIDQGYFKSPVWVQITDFNLHRMWVMPHIQGYFVANDEVAFRLQQNGISAERIHITGIPIMPAFATPQNCVDHLNTYGLSANSPILLLMGGGAGLGELDAIAKQLLAQQEQFQIIAVAGKNKKTLQALQQVAKHYPERLFPQGFTDKIEQLMACANLIITKPGGLTSSECLAMGLPMIVHAPIPGQEEHNTDYLLEQGVALKAIDTTGLTYRIKHLINNPEQLATMRQQAKKLAHPLAAQTVLDIVMQPIDNSP